MRILEFNVNKQRLNKKLDCDFKGLVAGSVGYLRAKFYFSENDWNNCAVRVARFWLNDQEHARMLDNDNCCDIPSEVLIGSKFEVSVLGAATGYKIETNRIAVRQEVH